jgi:pyridoxal 5'-phosphate synthase pdxS subunit
LRQVSDDIRRLTTLPREELVSTARDLGAPVETVREVAKLGRLPVVMFVAGGIATPADAALCMQLGAEGVFVGSGIFKSADPAKTAKAIVSATHYFDDPKVVLEVSKEIGAPMAGLEIGQIPKEQLMAGRGW